METTLHRQLKALYAAGFSGDASHGDGAPPAAELVDSLPETSDQQEVTVDGYRIDAVADDCLIEIQAGSLGAIRSKVRRLLRHHYVLIVKPLVGRKYLVKRKRRGGKIVSSRYSPLRGSVYNLFDDLVHFVDVFPHPRLTLEVLLTEQVEHRRSAPPRGRFRRDYRVDDRALRKILERRTLRTTEDLLALLPAGLPQPFSTEDLAVAADVPRWMAQKMAYCLRKTNVASVAGKQGNAILYGTASPADRAA